MVDDVRLAVGRRCDVRFHGRLGGVIPLPDEILARAKEVMPKPVVAAAEEDTQDQEPEHVVA
jgi:hypothetical protein